MAGRPPINEAPTFGRNLAALRKARGWTQPQLVEMLGISLNALVHYERKATNPSAEFLGKVAKLFNVTTDELLGHAVKAVRKPGPPSQLEARLEQVRKLPRPRQKLVLELLDTILRDSEHGHSNSR
jgi:transcriptional regulator with XRE-family HTH domain